VDPVLGSVIGSGVASLVALAIAVINGRNSADRLRLEDLVRRLRRRLIDKHGEAPEDVDNL
jgi:hypothetical protein